jgi:hypothetical protein
MVNVPPGDVRPSVQPELPVNVQVPVTLFQVVVWATVLVIPVAVPVSVSTLPLPFTVKVTFAVAVGSLTAEVTSNVPPTVSPNPVTGKHGPAVRKFKLVTFNAPVLLTENVVSKLNSVSLAGGP